MPLLEETIETEAEQKIPPAESASSSGQTPRAQKLSHTSDDPRFQADYKVKPLKSSGYERLEFLPTSLRFLTFFDESIRNGTFTLHKWQCETNEDISLGQTRDYRTSEVLKTLTPASFEPYQFALCAANGSGKDAFVIAPVALWFITTKIESKVIITSSSGDQLSSQTEHYIYSLARKVNVWARTVYGQDIIKIVKRHLTCMLTGSVIHMFCTDEKEKAEGHHPTAPGREMMIIVNEAKSVNKDIFDALNRCTGYNVWLDISSPGQPSGMFYHHFTTWENKRRVSYFDCPHHSPKLFEDDRILYGEHSAYFRSKWLALFTSLEGKYVVSEEHLNKLLRKIRNGLVPEILQNQPVRIGIDIALSKNGDETVISIWKGNKQIDQKTYRIQDSTILTAAISEYLLKHVPKDHKYIFADDGGVGRAVIDQLNAKGHNITRVLNNSTSKNRKQYKNRGAQLWYKFSRLIEAGLLIFKDLNDITLLSQIKSRKYKEHSGGNDILQLEAKADMIAEGLPSPDRADAAVLAFADISLDAFLKHEELPSEPKLVVTLSPLEAKRQLERDLFKNNAITKMPKVRGSLNVLLQQQNRQQLPV